MRAGFLRACDPKNFQASAAADAIRRESAYAIRSAVADRARIVAILRRPAERIDLCVAAKIVTPDDAGAGRAQLPVGFGAARWYMRCCWWSRLR